MELKNKYLVVKWDDIHAALSSSQERQLLWFLSRVEEYRTGQGKFPNTYIVVNIDEPYAEQVEALVKRQEEELGEKDE